jgi:hypothetical protein
MQGLISTERMLRLMLLLLALAAGLSQPGAPAPTLRDHPIESGEPPLYLDGDGWTASHHHAPGHPHPGPGPPPAAWAAPVAAVVPGDILTDLQRAGGPDPYFNSTWREPGFIETWNEGLWTYSMSFGTPVGTTQAFLLVFDGIRMGAMIHLNGHHLGNATDQFLRYTFPVGCAVLQCSATSAAASATATALRNNTLTVTFGAALEINTHGRYTYSAQIDWAPAMLTTANFPHQPNTFGFGIWKSVYLLPVTSAAIAHVVPHTFYAGGHPTSILSDTVHKGFEVRVLVELVCPTGGCSGAVSVLGGWPGAVAVTARVASVPAGTSNVTCVLSAAQTRNVKLWHPHGHGAQHRYPVTATFTPVTGGPPAVASRKMGFRHVALVTTNDTEPEVAATAASADGNGQLTMFFRVNGAPVFARGGNKIPMDLLDGRMSAAAHRRLVQSAVDANFNMLRVWGGGIWEPRAFWEACDELGVLLYTDLQFTDGSVAEGPIAPGPTPDPGGSTESIEVSEIEYQLKRTGHHPSIAMWDSCNECIRVSRHPPHGYVWDHGTLYETMVMPTVAAIDRSRPIWPGCPAPGWISGVDRLTSRPNGQRLRMGAGGPTSEPRPEPFPFPLEAHGPYFAGNGSVGMSQAVMPSGSAPQPAVTGAVNTPTAVPAWTGPGEIGWYRSEFGCVSWSSFESMSGQMPPDQWGMSTAAAKNRNWNASNVMMNAFGAQVRKTPSWANFSLL